MRLVLLHALARTGLSLRPLSRFLRAQGHETHIIPYRSRRMGLAALAHDVAGDLHRLGLAGGGPDIGFITHSMGGLVLRALPLALPNFRAGRSVCLGGPLNGSIVATTLRSWPVVPRWFGPAFRELDPQFVSKLPQAPCDYASIAGTRWSPLLPSAHVLAHVARGQASDSTVLVEETRGPGCLAHAEVDEIHSFLPDNREARRLIVSFLDEGAFSSRAG